MFSSVNPSLNGDHRQARPPDPRIPSGEEGGGSFGSSGPCLCGAKRTDYIGVDCQDSRRDYRGYRVTGNYRGFYFECPETHRGASRVASSRDPCVSGGRPLSWTAGAGVDFVWTSQSDLSPCTAHAPVSRSPFPEPATDFDLLALVPRPNANQNPSLPLNPLIPRDIFSPRVPRRRSESPPTLEKGRTFLGPRVKPRTLDFSF